MSERGQTIHDYLLGVVLVLLTVAVTIGILGSAFEPFFDPVDNEDQIMADNLADELIELNQTQFSERTIDLDGLEAVLDDEDAFDRVKQRAGLPSYQQANVTIQQSGETLNSYDGVSDPGDEPAAQSVRFVRNVHTDGDCNDGCLLIVRVW